MFDCIIEHKTISITFNYLDEKTDLRYYNNYYNIKKNFSARIKNIFSSSQERIQNRKGGTDN